MQYNDSLTKEEAIQFRSKQTYWIVKGSDCFIPVFRDMIQFDVHSFDYLVENETPEEGVMLFDNPEEAMMHAVSNQIKELESAIQDFKKKVNPDSWKMYVDDAFDENYGKYMKKDVSGGQEVREKLYKIFVETHGQGVLLKKKWELRRKMLEHSMKSGAILPDFDIDRVLKEVSDVLSPSAKSDWSVIGTFEYSELHVLSTYSNQKDEVLVSILKGDDYLMKSCLFNQDARQSILDWIRKSYWELCVEYRRMMELGFHLILEQTYHLEVRKAEDENGEISPRLKEIEIRPAGDRVFIDVRVPGDPGVMKTLRSVEVSGDLVEEAEKLLIQESFDEEYPLPPDTQKEVNKILEKYPDLVNECLRKSSLDMEINSIRKELTSFISSDEIDEEKAVSLVKALAKALKEKKELK